MTPAEIRKLRRKLNLTQSQFAARLGIHKITLSRWENGAALSATAVKLLELLAAQRPTTTTTKPRRGRRKTK